MPRSTLDKQSEAIDTKLHSAVGRGGVYVDQAKERVAPIVADAKDRVAPIVTEAVDRGGVYVEQAKDWAAPRLDDAKQRAAPVVAGAVATVVPLIEHALEDASSRIAAALESTGPARAEVSRRSTAAVAALKGELDAPKAKSHWGRRLALLGLFAGIGAAVFAFVRRKDTDDSWITAESTYPSTNGARSTGGSTSGGESGTTGSAPTSSTTTEAGASGSAPAKSAAAKKPAASKTTKATSAEHSHDIEGTKAGEVADGTYEAGDEQPAQTDDQAGAGFDEAASDATDEPKEPTTPDEPAERTTPKDA